MVLTLRKDKNKYYIVDKESGEVKASFETKGEALAYKEEPPKWNYPKSIKGSKGGKNESNNFRWELHNLFLE